ncbi:Uma2 family endonuclease [Roseofilum casamattae]|uniref:Uma2 family endonuclease n=1 Tax=Roseofilum casamattae BLCC-M143 TaxID=3022442 RepID=A0ABT7C2W4_9CYAN|nr:Uma2 family endonuclease [Roseofilum casamattae]MDJ1185789.1 Uma2 family endonuclease [Roseofilum casamattae BLCC-M143]
MLDNHPHPHWQKTLPTMYDLPSEDPEEPGLPDQFHDLQPTLLAATFNSPVYPENKRLIAKDLNLYYDVRHTHWYKRPDWFLVLNNEDFGRQEDLRLSYLIWQEGIAPFLVVELLSPGTESEDLGQTLRDVNRPPTKWQVYEQILRVPYYAIYDRYENQFRAFRLDGVRYQELSLTDNRLWFEELQLGLGRWQGTYDRFEGLWLRWYDAKGNWIPTPTERAERERQSAEQERERAEQERERARQERERAEQERERAQQERERAEQAEANLLEERRQREALLQRLQEMGIDLDS